MNTHTPRAQQHRQVQSLAVLAMFTAILFLLTFTPIGMIDLPIIKATVLHVPVIIGALLLGPKKGAFLGGMFGLASLLKNTLVPNLSSFAFSPLIPVPGLDRGSPWALVVCFVPRILVGVTPWLVYTLLQALSRRRLLCGSGMPTPRPRGFQPRQCWALFWASWRPTVCPRPLWRPSLSPQCASPWERLSSSTALPWPPGSPSEPCC